MERFEINKIRLSENLLYVLLWAMTFFVPLLNAAMTSLSDLQLYEIVEAWCKILPYFLIFLVNNNLLISKYLLRKRYGVYILLDIILIAILFLIVDYVQYNVVPVFRNVFPAFQHTTYSTKLMTGEVSFTDLNLFWNSTLALFMSAANAGISLVYRSIQDEQQMEALKRHNMQVEMDYLKYQINPHFFMNTLNNIHALIDINADTAKRTVIELSKMMRYVLYESGSESISLRQDLQFIGNYIELMRIRFDGDIDIRLNYAENLPVDSSIPPLLLIVFIENAFKHGFEDEAEVEAGGYIDLKIDYMERGSKICYTVENSLPREKRGDIEAGIGLYNVRRRLDLLFGRAYSLRTEMCEDRYFVQLIIPLQGQSKNEPKVVMTKI